MPSTQAGLYPQLVPYTPLKRGRGAADGRVYILDRNGAAAVIQAGREPKVLAVNTLEDGFDASPALADGDLYLRGRRFLYRITETPPAKR